MKYVAYGLMAAFLAAAVYGAIPDKAAGWYTPDKFSIEVTSGVLEVQTTDEYGNTDTIEYPVYVDEDGYVFGMNGTAITAVVLDSVSYKALQAFVLAVRNKDRIETIGRNLHDLTSKTGIKITNPQTRQSYTIKFDSGTIAETVGGSGGEILATTDEENPADMRSLNWTDSSASSKIQLYGWGSQAANGNLWGTYSTPVTIPVRTAAGATMAYHSWYGVDGLSLAPNDSTHKLELSGWTAANNCNESIQNLLTNETETATLDRSRHKILTRYDDGKGTIIHWMPFAETTIGGEGHADNKSIVLAKDEDASSADPKKFRLKGFDTAKPEQAKDGAVLPFVDATHDYLQWSGIETFFAASVFRKSETTGKMLLNGTSEEGKVKVLAMTGSGGDDQHVNSLAFDARSVDGENGVVQVHGFNTAPSPFDGGVNFTDALTNMSISIANMSVPLRVPTSGGYEVKYAPLAKITGIPAAPVDDVTIELNKTDPLNPKLQLHGAAGDGITLEDGDVYMIGSDLKGKFGKFGADGDDSEAESGLNSLDSYTNTKGERFFRLKGWDVNYETPQVLGKGDGGLKYYEADGNGGVETKNTSAGDWLQLSNYDTATEGALPYKNGETGLAWLAGVNDRIPLLHNSSAPTTMAIGGSLDKANVSAVPTLNVSGFIAGGNCTAKLNKMLSDPSESSNRSAHQFMARYSNGGTPTVHWVGIDDVIAGGGVPDDASITTNMAHGAVTSGMASIFGFRTASADDVPHKNSDGSITWKPAGGALIVEGTSGSTVTQATCTNKLSFVSAPDSNVKFTVTDEGGGNVKVMVGVYYK